MTTPPPVFQESIGASLSKLDSALLNILVKDGRASFADIARQLGVSRAHARARVQALVSSGVIELFGAVINPQGDGRHNSWRTSLPSAKVQVTCDCELSVQRNTSG
ncbi:MAG: AsnC family transcriptional regulator [Rhodoferax sp.]|uniref:Lrp/AsnC family transcriptional regulator n=1 Tax=Rhodoferax sp. TaxID=50421 RepID=UPI003C78CFCB